MNKNHYALLVLCFSLIFSFTEPNKHAIATVGGPTYISSVAYKSQDNSVYYTVHGNGGRGCPPIIHKIDLATQKDTEVKSCTQVEEEFFNSGYEIGMQKYSQFIADTYQNLSYLGSVSLQKNNIRIDIESVSEHAEDGWVLWNEFQANISQSGAKLAELNFRGCAKDQPHIFEGYRVPNSDAMAVLISNKGDCFEGGYVREKLYIVKGVQYLDTNIVRSIKEESATEPNRGNMVLYATLEETANNATSTPSTPSASPRNVRNEILILTGVLIIGASIGYVAGRKSRTQP